VWFLLGESYRALHRDDESIAAYEKSTKSRGPREFDARYQLAEAKLAKGLVDEARYILERNLEFLRGQPDCAAHEKTLLTLGDLLFERQDYGAAADHLEQALKRYPGGAKSARALYQLAESYRRLALREIQIQGASARVSPEFAARSDERFRQWMTLARDNFQKLADGLAMQQAVGRLSAFEESLLVYASFAVPECRFDLGKYAEAFAGYQELAARYRGREEGLRALAGMFKCQVTNPDQATATLQRLRQALDETDFSRSPGAWSRQQWESWLETVSKPLTPGPAEQATAPPRGG
jgi:tetratricopeptide (TPR) repeat protein